MHDLRRHYGTWYLADRSSTVVWELVIKDACFVHGARLDYFWIRGVFVARGTPSSAVTMDDRMDTKHGMRVHVFVLKNGNKEESASETRSTARWFRE